MDVVQGGHRSELDTGFSRPCSVTETDDMVLVTQRTFEDALDENPLRGSTSRPWLCAPMRASPIPLVLCSPGILHWQVAKSVMSALNPRMHSKRICERLARGTQRRKCERLAMNEVCEAAPSLAFLGPLAETITKCPLMHSGTVTRSVRT